jgi:hypothetical protein
MLDVIVVLWLGSAPPLPHQRTDIAAWAEARRLSPVAPEVAPTPSYDPKLGAQIEALLEEARSGPAAPGAPPGASAFERAEALLTAHPELPQAAWLLAERYALEAHALGKGSAQTEQRRTLLARAQALEGGRAAPAGHEPSLSAPRSDVAAASTPAVALAGARSHDRVFIDGVVGTALTPGRHHVQLYRGAQRVWAGWIETEAGPVLTDPTRACSALDLADVVGAPEGPRPAPGVLCARWLAARPAPLGGTEVAECSTSRCGRWEAPSPARATPEAAGLALTEDASAWPAWATWGLVGAGVATAAGVVLWRSGVFDRSSPETEFTFTGPSAATYRF